jgi:hypothetical protein
MVNKIEGPYYLRHICLIVRWIENDPVSRSLVHYKNILVLMEQLLILLYTEHTVAFDIEVMRHVLRDAVYLLKSSVLVENLRPMKRSCWWWSQ